MFWKGHGRSERGPTGAAGALRRQQAFAMSRDWNYEGGPTEDNPMPIMSDSRRKKIQAKQRKAKNTLKREAKAAKRERKTTEKSARA